MVDDEAFPISEGQVRVMLASFSLGRPLVLPERLYRAAEALGLDLSNAVIDRPLPTTKSHV